MSTSAEWGTLDENYSEAEALTAEFESVPSSHDGSWAFTVQLTFSGDRPILETVLVTVVRTALIASFSEMPGEHDGSALTFKLHFSEEL